MFFLAPGGMGIRVRGIYNVTITQDKSNNHDLTGIIVGRLMEKSIDSIYVNLLMILSFII